MKTLFENAVYSGVIISLVSYGLGTALKKRFRSALFNPVLISVVLIIAFLAVFDINYESLHQIYNLIYKRKNLV